MVCPCRRDSHPQPPRAASSPRLAWAAPTHSLRRFPEPADPAAHESFAPSCRSPVFLCGPGLTPAAGSFQFIQLCFVRRRELFAEQPAKRIFAVRAELATVFLEHIPVTRF